MRKRYTQTHTKMINKEKKKKFLATVSMFAHMNLNLVCFNNTNKVQDQLLQFIGFQFADTNDIFMYSFDGRIIFR